jgi:hypothetical protein
MLRTFHNFFAILRLIVFRALVDRKVKLCVISSYTFEKKTQANYLLSVLIIGFDKVRDRSTFRFATISISFVMSKTH